jgi:hypothetical protein
MFDQDDHIREGARKIENFLDHLHDCGKSLEEIENHFGKDERLRIAKMKLHEAWMWLHSWNEDYSLDKI